MTEQAAHILVVDDDDRLRSLLKKYLSGHGFAVSTAASASEARKAMALFLFDLLVLDVMMPGETGLQLAHSLRHEGSETPILMLSAKGEAEERIAGLEAGADDYLPKPFEPHELLLRIHSVMRRRARAAPPATADPIQFGDFTFDPELSLLTQGGIPIHLTTAESAVLRMLAERAPHPVSREELMQACGTASERNVDVQITRLRRKIETDSRPQHIQTVRGAGYALIPL